MIPRPPGDPVLGRGLDRLLSGSAVAEALKGPLEGLRVESCRPSYARYKPGTSCLVEYELTLQEPGAAAFTVSAHARLFASGRARALATRRSLGRLSARAARHHAGPPASRSFYAEAIDALVALFPVDRELPGLVRASAPRKVTRDLGLPDGRSVRAAELVRYKPGRKALFRYRLEGAHERVLYGKVYAGGQARGRRALAEAFLEAGVTTPPVVADVPALELVVQAEARGTRLADLRGSDAFAGGVAQAAAALAALHEAHPVPELALVPGGEPAVLAAGGRLLASVLPARRAQVERLVRAISGSSERLETLPIHGDFYDDQVLVGATEVTLLDLDEARLGDPLVDVGNFLAHLSREGSLGPARERFLDAYLTLRPVREERVRLFEAAGLLKLAIEPFRRLRPDWPERVEELIELAAERLATGSRRRSPCPTFPHDPKLPQLESLRDPELVARELERELCGRPVEIRRIEVVRHKPGRRSTLALDISVAGAVRRVYGKTYASGRAAGVHEVLQRLSEARACGEDVELPRAIAYVPALRLALQSGLAGTAGAAAFLAGDTALARRVAEALHALHNSRVELPRQHTIANELDPLRLRVEQLAEVVPRLARRARSSLALLEEQVVGFADWRFRPVHRDFYHDQLLVENGRVGVLDWDDAAMSEPAVDVANILAHLRLLALQHPGSAEAVARSAAALRERYRSLDGELSQALVRSLEAATLVRLAHIHLSRARGALLAVGLLEASQRLLAESDQKNSPSR